jgi:hypothetical protein
MRPATGETLLLWGIAVALALRLEVISWGLLREVAAFAAAWTLASLLLVGAYGTAVAIRRGHLVLRRPRRD